MITKEELRTLVEQNLSTEKEHLLLSHARDCLSCQRQIGEIFAIGPEYSSLSESEMTQLKKQINLLVQKNNQSVLVSWQFLINFVLCIQPSSLAAANDQTSDQKLTKAALSSRVLFFEALCRKAESGYWRAELTLPSASTPDTQLSIRFMDAQGNLISGGTLTFCGIEKPVKNGRCYLSITELRENIRNQTISFRKEGQTDIKGILELFPEEKDGL
jgi:hypothetical protein